ncbi:hypothetical protein N7488_001295 [Penicillium malachiteum]|nr:hypothetical protein N7488_001295 [Penicillium malachiteum]
MPDQPNCALFDAIDKNDLLEVQKALSDKANPNARDDDGYTALFKATKSAIDHNDLEIMEALLKSGADPHMESGDYEAPIHYAAYWNGSPGLLELLLSKGTDVNLQRGLDSSTPLFRAVKDGNLEVTRLLLEHGADPNLENDYGGAPLHWAAYYGCCDEIIDLLLANKANIDLKRRIDGVTPLYEAVRGGELEIAKKLINENSDLNIINNEKETFLHLAVHYQTMDFINLFKWSKECPIDVNSLTSDNDTPLIFAASAGSISCVEWLLQQGADVNIRNKFRRTAFLLCAQAGNVEVASLLVNRSQKVIHAIDIDGRGAFHHAASWGHSDFIEWFHNIREAPDVDLGESDALDPNRTDIYGMSFIHRALDFYEPSIVENCLKFCRSSIVDEVDQMGNTPLHTALNTASDRVEIQSILIKNMSLSARCRMNNEGESILYLATESAIRNANLASEGSGEGPCKNFLLDLFRRPLDVENDKSGAWPTIIRCDPAHVAKIEHNLKALFPDPILPETIIFWAARNGAKDLWEQGLAGLADSAQRKNIITEALYWASASEQSEIVTIITDSYQKEVRFDAKTIKAIQVAAFAGYESIVCSLLRCIRTDQQRPQSTASKGLFWAVTWKNEHARDVVRRLLMNGASVNSVADGGITILQWAENYNKAARLGKEEKEYDMLGLLESPIRVPLQPKAPQRPKAKDDLGGILDKHMCTISDFYCHNNAFYTLQRRSKCREVIYAEGVAKRMKESWNEWFPNHESRMPDFRWVHLPLNDWKFAKDLMNTIYSETPTADLEYARCETFVEGSQKEHTGSPQSKFMYPAFHVSGAKKLRGKVFPA